MSTKCTAYQGDPAIKITQDGATMQFIGGQPIMDAGFENALQISLFTRRGWFGNAFLRKPAQKIGSDFESRCNQPITIDSINNIEDAAVNATKWMIDEKIASAIDIEVTNPRSDNIKTTVLVHPNADDVKELQFLRNGQNWINQSQDPAHDRFSEVI